MNGTITLESNLGGEITMANTIINGGASPYPKGASGSIITITDGAENTPLKSAVVNIEPAQDLHGYDYPWPAGGGVNILPEPNLAGTVNGVTIAQDGNKYTLTGTASAYSQKVESGTITLAAGTYTLSAYDQGTGVYAQLRSTDGQTTYANTAGGVSNTFTLAAETVVKTRLIINANTVTGGRVVKLQLEKGNTATAFAPYSNICPISGWSQVDVWVKPIYDTSLTPTATIPLGRTVYGGTPDVVRGKLAITHAGVKMGDKTWFYDSTYTRMYTSLYDSKIEGTRSQTLLCSAFATYDSGGTIGSVPNNSIYNGGTNRNVYIKTDLYTDPTAFKTAFANDIIVYPLETPIEVDLTPHTIKTLKGTNNIWADAGEMSIEYYPAAASIVAVQNRSTKAYVSIPLGMIRYETYQITPQQTIDLDSYRSENGNLLRNPVATKCKLEFNTPLMTDTQWAEIWNFIKAGFNNSTERKLKLKYYDTLSATYKTGYFYVPDVQTTIRNIEEDEGVINYQEIRLAFIEY